MKMSMHDDLALLRRYATEKSEAAFATLVERNVGLVYAAALRQLGGSVHRAREVTQIVFIDLARKAPALAGRDDLAGWLYTSTHYAAAKLKRGEARRERREQEASLMHELTSENPSDAEWERLRPVLDEAMLALSESDRAAILLRFFQGRRFAEVGEQLRLSEDAARMRVERALDKLRVLLGQRGITSTTAALGLALAHPAVAAAPAGLAAAVTGSALAGGVAGSAATGIFFMQTGKMILSAIVFVAAGVAIVQFNTAREAEARAFGLAAERDELQRQLVAERQRAKETAARNVALQREPTATRSAKSPVPASASSAGVLTIGGAPLVETSGKLTVSAGTLSVTQMPTDPAERQRLLKRQSDDATNTSYAALYRLMGWDAAQQERFRDLMFERRQSAEKLFAAAVRAAREQNPALDRAGSHEIFEATQAQAQIEDQAEVRRLFGDAAAQTMERYQSHLPVRSAVTQLATALFATDAPLQQDQAERLIDVLAQNARGLGGRVELTALDIEAAATQAQTLLAPRQIEELRRVAVRAQEQARRERERNVASVGELRVMSAGK